MAKFEVGVLGNFEGKVGTVVGAKWKGIEYMRHKGRKSKKPFTESQLEQQARFRCVARFVSKFSDLLMACYSDTPLKTAINHAFGDIYANAIIGNYPAYSLDYSKVQICDGSLHNANSLAVSAAGGGNVKFTWIDNTNGPKAKATDKAVLAVYCPELDQAIFTLQGAERRAGSDSLNVMNFTGKVVETWIGFMSANGQLVSSSFYTGQLTVS
jgi:hypothetical protein